MDATPEEWRPVVGWEAFYEVSNRGRIRSIERTVIYSNGVKHRYPQRIRCLGFHRSGHVLITLWSNQRALTRQVHLLVLEAFVGLRPDGHEACHNDGDPANNCLENLRWDTHSSNVVDSVGHGTHANASKSHCKRGHEFTDGNTAIRQGYRHCRTCHRERERWRRRRAASVTD